MIFYHYTYFNDTFNFEGWPSRQLCSHFLVLCNNTSGLRPNSITYKPITQRVVSSFLFFGFNLLKTLFGSLIALPDSFGFKHWTSPHFKVFRWRQKVIVFYTFWLGSCNFLDGFRALKGLNVFIVWWFLTNDWACIPFPLKERLNLLSRIL